MPRTPSLGRSLRARAGVRRARNARVRSVATLAAASLAVAACRGATAPGPLGALPVDITTLAGRWAGSLEGAIYGYSTITVVLRADSTMSQEAQNPSYPPLTGVWSVSGAQFTVSARDRNGVIVNLAAPLSRTRLTGTWKGPTVTSVSGTFTIAKQP
jgi:hypothetical protein